MPFTKSQRCEKCGRKAKFRWTYVYLSCTKIKKEI